MSIKKLLGNDRIKAILTNYLTNRKIPFSLIFSGPSSARIFDFAFNFAKAINCLEEGDDCCEHCRNCVEANKGVFPDLWLLSPDGQNYKKDQILQLIEDNIKMPVTGKRKIYILRNAHKMTASSANSFLKVLEEPAESSIFILLTSNLNSFLPTIKSRCQILNFSILSRVEVKKFLIEGGMEEKKANILSYLNGSESNNVLDVDFEELQQKRGKILQVVECLLKDKGVENILLDLSEKSKSRSKFPDYFQEMINLISLLLRDIMVTKIDKECRHLINIDFRDKIIDLSRYVSMDKILFLIHKMEMLLRDIQRNMNLKVLILEFIGCYGKRGVIDV